MALKDILQVIDADADREVAAIRRAAEEATAVRLQEAETEAAAVRQRVLAEAQIAAEQQAARLLHRARLETLRHRVEVQETAFRMAVGRARKSLESARERPDYDAMLGALLDEALSGFDEPVTIVVHPDDAAAIRSKLQQKITVHPPPTSPRNQGEALGLPSVGRGIEGGGGERLQQKSENEHTVETSAEVSMGVVVHSQDGRIVIENTLHSRLERALPDLRAQIADLLSDTDISSPDAVHPPPTSPRNQGEAFKLPSVDGRIEGGERLPSTRVT